MALTAHMVTIDCADPRALSTFWTAALSYAVSNDMGDGAFLILAPDNGGSDIHLGLQQVSEPRVGKNRVHIDFSAPVLDDEVARLERLGAARVDRQTLPGGFTWQVMADPEGNVFCVSQG